MIEQNEFNESPNILEELYNLITNNLFVDCNIYD